MHSIVIFSAQYLIALPVLITVYMAVRLNRSKRLELLALLLIGSVVSLLLAKIGSHLYYDPRPFVSDHITPLIPHANDNGFPSDHTLLAAFLGFVVLVFSKKLGAVLLIIALLVGAARVAAGVHHAPDIVGGFVAAGLGVLVAYGCIKLYRGKR